MFFDDTSTLFTPSMYLTDPVSSVGGRSSRTMDK